MSAVTAPAPHSAAMQYNHAPNGADSDNPMYVLRIRGFDIRAYRKCIGAINRKRFALLVQQTSNFALRIMQMIPEDRANSAALERCARP